MYFCDRCGRRVSAEEATIHSPPDGVGGNLILCNSCSSGILIHPRKPAPKNTFIGGILLILAAIGCGLAWFALFFLTAYPWDFLSVLAGWGIARLIIRVRPLDRSSREGLVAILLTGLAIITREYLMLSLVVDYTTSAVPAQTGFSLQPPTVFAQALVSHLSANPFTILMWMLSFWITFVTAVGVRSNK